MSKNHPKIYTKPPNGGYGNKQRDLALLKTWPRYWQKGRVKRCQNSLQVYPRLKSIMGNIFRDFGKYSTAKIRVANGIRHESFSWQPHQNMMSWIIWQSLFPTDQDPYCLPYFPLHLFKPKLNT